MRFEYVAFLSYRRENKSTARLLQNLIESIEIPKDRAPEWTKDYLRSTPSPTQVKQLGSVLRDETHLGGAAHLTQSIKAGLAASCALIVVCTKETTEPRAGEQQNWVDDEVAYYLEACAQQKREPKIIPVIVDPGHSDIRIDDYYPPSLREFARRVLGGPQNLLRYQVQNVRWSWLPSSFFAQTFDAQALHTASAIAARIFDLKLEVFYNRELHRQRKRVLSFAGTAVLTIAALATLSVVAISQRNHAHITDAYGRAVLANQCVRDGASLMAYKWAKFGLDPVAGDPNQVATRWASEVSLNRALQNLHIRGGVAYNALKEPVGVFFSGKNDEWLTVVDADGTIKKLNLPKGAHFTNVRETDTSKFYALPKNSATDTGSKILQASTLRDALVLLDKNGTLHLVREGQAKVLTPALPEAENIMMLTESSDGRLIALRTGSIDVISIASDKIQDWSHALPPGFHAAAMAPFHHQPRIVVGGICDKSCAGPGFEGAIMTIDLDGKAIEPPTAVTTEAIFTIGVASNDGSQFALDLDGHFAYRRADSIWKTLADDASTNNGDVYFAGAFSADGKTVLTASNQGRLRQIDVASGTPKAATISNNIDINESIYRVISRDTAPEFAIVGARTIVSFDTSPLLSVRVKPWPAAPSALLPVANGVIVGSEDGRVTWLDSDLAKQQEVGTCVTAATTFAAIDSNHIGALTKDGQSCQLTIDVHAASRIDSTSYGSLGKIVRGAASKTPQINRLEIAPGEELDCPVVKDIVSATRALASAKAVLIEPIRAGEPQPAWLNGASGCLSIAPELNVRAVSRNGEWLVSESHDDKLQPVTATLRNRNGRTIDIVSNPFGMSRYAFSSDNFVLAALSPGTGHLQLVDTRSGKPFAYFELPSTTIDKQSHGPYTQIAFSSNNSHIYVTGRDLVFSVPVPERYGPKYSLNDGPVNLLGDVDFTRLYLYPEALLNSE